jgi:cytoskeletal protein CcmA (bactofilin family)
MKTTYKFLTILLFLALLLAPVTSASAQGLAVGFREGRVIFGDNYVLSAGETLAGDLVVFGGNVTIEDGAIVEGSVALFGGNASVAEGARIDGDVAMFGGSLQMNGKVNGDVAMLGGDASLGETAFVDGDVSMVGGKLERAEGAEISGDIVNEVKSPTVVIPSLPLNVTSPEVPDPNVRINIDPFWNFFGSLSEAVGVAILLAGIAALASLFLQPQMERVSDVVISQPLVAGGFGLLTVVLAPFALVILAVTLILSPVAFLGVVVLALAWLFGVIALGQEVGERLTQSFHLTWSAPLVAGLGTLLLVLATNLLGLVPCFGWMAPFLLGLVGIGGVAVALLNTRKPQVVTAVAAPVDEVLPPAS